MKDNFGNTINFPVTSEIKCNKSSLNKIILYTSSRYNACKKADVVSDIIYHVERGEDCFFTWESGIYTESGYHSGKEKIPNCKYTLEINKGNAVLYNFTPDTYHIYPKTNFAYCLLKPQKNIYFLPAKKVSYILASVETGRKGLSINTNGIKTLWGIPEGIYNVFDQNKDCFFTEYEGSKRHLEKEYCSILYTENLGIV